MQVRNLTLPGGIDLIEVEGTLLGGEEINALRKAIDKSADTKATKLIVDLGGVTHVNSAALGVLVAAAITYSRRGWQLRICETNKAVHSIFIITKLNLLFDLVTTRDEAVKSFK